MAGVIFYGLGIVRMPGRDRNIRFINGEYLTTDSVEIELLSKRYRHDIIKPEISDDIEGDEKPKRGRKPKNA